MLEGEAFYAWTPGRAKGDTTLPIESIEFEEAEFEGADTLIQLRSCYLGLRASLE